jgi:hypothetical protein
VAVYDGAFHDLGSSESVAQDGGALTGCGERLC